MTDDEMSTELAQLDEEQELQVQLQEIREATIRPGLLRLPVKYIGSSKKNEAMVVELFHPVEEEQRFYFDKPSTGWHDGEDFVRFLNWYGYTSSNYRTMQKGDAIYVRWNGVENEWEITKPPSRPTKLNWAIRKSRQIYDMVEHRHSVPAIIQVVSLWTIAPALLTLLLLSNPIITVGSAFAGLIVGTMVGTATVPSPGRLEK